MLVGWGILSPLSKFSGWAPGPVGDMTNGARGWILWIALAIMCVDSIVSLVPVIWEYIVEIMLKRKARRNADDKEDGEDETEDRLVPNSWVIWGLSGSICIGCVLVWVVFGGDIIRPWATVIGFMLGGILSVLG
jgi:hypothetical protein